MPYKAKTTGKPTTSSLPQKNTVPVLANWQYFPPPKKNQQHLHSLDSAQMEALSYEGCPTSVHSCLGCCDQLHSWLSTSCAPTLRAQGSRCARWPCAETSTTGRILSWKVLQRSQGWLWKLTSPALALCTMQLVSMLSRWDPSIRGLDVCYRWEASPQGPDK